MQPCLVVSSKCAWSCHLPVCLWVEVLHPFLVGVLGLFWCCLDVVVLFSKTSSVLTRKEEAAWNLTSVLCVVLGCSFWQSRTKRDSLHCFVGVDHLFSRTTVHRSIQVIIQRVHFVFAVVLIVFDRERGCWCIGFGWLERSIWHWVRDPRFSP